MSEVQRRRRLYEIVETVSGGHPAFADDPERIEWTNNIVDAIEDVAHGIDRPDIMSRI